MNIEKLFLVFIITSISVSVLGLGQNCISTLVVSISSTDAISLDGFIIEIDGNPMATTHNGAAVIDLSELSSGGHRVAVSKDEGGYHYEGIKDINIPCINASARGQQRIAVQVRLTQRPPDDGADKGDMPWSRV
jgi:hypothetical protein